MIGGSVNVTSELGKGSQFHINLRARCKVVPTYFMQSGGDSQLMVASRRSIFNEATGTADWHFIKEVEKDLLLMVGCHPPQERRPMARNSMSLDVRAAASNNQLVQAPALEPLNPAQFSVLVVNDDQFQKSIVCQLFERAGFIT